MTQNWEDKLFYYTFWWREVGRQPTASKHDPCCGPCGKMQLCKCVEAKSARIRWTSHHWTLNTDLAATRNYLSPNCLSQKFIPFSTTSLWKKDVNANSNTTTFTEISTHILLVEQVDSYQLLLMLIPEYILYTPY